MHTYEGAKTTFLFNSDLSGSVRIVINKYSKTDRKEFEVPGQDLLDFVAEYVRGEKICRLEQMETSELLDLLRST